MPASRVLDDLRDNCWATKTFRLPWRWSCCLRF